MKPDGLPETDRGSWERVHCNLKCHVVSKRQVKWVKNDKEILSKGGELNLAATLASQPAANQSFSLLLLLS